MPATIDDALELLEDAGPEFAGELANQGPMAAMASPAFPAAARDAAQLLSRS